MASYERTNYLAHYGILGQKWGVRRFQNPDGSLTALGKQRYEQNGYNFKGMKGVDEVAYYQNKQKELLQKPSSVTDEEMKDAFYKMRNYSKTEEERDKKINAWTKAYNQGLYDISWSLILFKEEM